MYCFMNTKYQSIIAYCASVFFLSRTRVIFTLKHELIRDIIALFGRLGGRVPTVNR